MGVIRLAAGGFDEGGDLEVDDVGERVDECPGIAGDSVCYSYFQGGGPGSSEIRPEVHRKFGCNVSKIPQKSATKEPPPRRGPSLPLSSLGL